MTVKVADHNLLGDLSTLIGDFEQSLRAANKTARTVHMEAFTADQLARFKPATASQRFRALAQLFKWLTEEGEIRTNPFDRMKPPRVPESLCPSSATRTCASYLGEEDRPGSRPLPSRSQSPLLR